MLSTVRRCNVYIMQVALLSSPIVLYACSYEYAFLLFTLKSNKPIQARSLHICTIVHIFFFTSVSSSQNTVVHTYIHRTRMDGCHVYQVKFFRYLYSFIFCWMYW